MVKFTGARMFSGMIGEKLLVAICSAQSQRLHLMINLGVRGQPRHEPNQNPQVKLNDTR